MKQVLSPMEPLWLLMVFLSAFLVGRFFESSKRRVQTWIDGIMAVVAFAFCVMFRMLLLTGLVCAISLDAQAAWSYKRTITIDHTKVGSSTHTDFPVLVAGTYSYLATTANGGKVQNANGYDVAFYSNADLTTQLKHEVESYTATTGAVVYWVKVPSVSHTDNTVIYMAYGNSSISTSQADAANVWDSNYQGVWHLNQDPSTTTQTDSTSNAYALTSSGSMASGDLVTAKVGNGLDLDGTDDYLYKATAANLHITGALTISAWINRVSGAIGGNEGIVSIWWNYGSYTNKRQYNMVLNTSGYLMGYLSSNGTNYVNKAGSSDLRNAWHHVSVVYVPSTSLTLYVDGESAGSNTTSIPSSLYNSSGMFAIGTQYVPTNADNAFYGKVDETRVSDKARSADWILAEYNSMNSPSTFYAVGTETSTERRGRAIIAGGERKWAVPVL